MGQAMAERPKSTRIAPSVAKRNLAKRDNSLPSPVPQTSTANISRRSRESSSINQHCRNVPSIIALRSSYSYPPGRRRSARATQRSMRRDPQQRTEDVNSIERPVHAAAQKRHVSKGWDASKAVQDFVLSSAGGGLQCTWVNRNSRRVPGEAQALHGSVCTASSYREDGAATDKIRRAWWVSVGARETPRPATLEFLPALRRVLTLRERTTMPRTAGLRDARGSLTAAMAAGREFGRRGAQSARDDRRPARQQDTAGWGHHGTNAIAGQNYCIEQYGYTPMATQRHNANAPRVDVDVSCLDAVSLSASAAPSPYRVQLRPLPESGNVSPSAGTGSLPAAESRGRIPRQRQEKRHTTGRADGGNRAQLARALAAWRAGGRLAGSLYGAGAVQVHNSTSA
jgi:hypothetical protein